MKMRQVVQMAPSNIYCGWGGNIQFNDSEGNEICIELTEKQSIDLADSLNDRVKRIYKDRYEEAKNNLNAAVEEC